MNNGNEALYQERLALFQKVINLEPVERIPVAYIGFAFAPRYMGMPIAKFCADPEAAFEVTLAAVDRLGGIDGVNQLPAGRISTALSTIWLSRIAVPGRELPEDSLWQVQEAEIMTVEDYETIISYSWDAFVRGYMPQIVDVAEYQTDMMWTVTNLERVIQKFREHGYVAVAYGVTAIPFEYLCGARSMSRFIIDLYRIPDTVQAAMDIAVPALIQQGIGMAQLSGVPSIWVGGWRAASALLAPKLWDRFVFPYYHQIVTTLAEHGITSVLHFDQNWTRDLARLRELPAKKCILNPDGMTDVRRAKELLGDHMAIMGDVPSTLFAAGTPDDIYNYVRDLVRDVGPTGLILCPGCDAPINTRPENMEAFVAAAREFGSIPQAA